MSSPAPAFAVLIPLWGGDRPDRARRALASATTGQQLRPAQLILSIDGPLPEPLEQVVADAEAGEFGPATVLRHQEHRGIALTLQDGLLASEHEIVARADADDLCRPERFALQIPRMRAADDEEGADLLGGAMQEFSDAVPPGTGILRRRPLEHQGIIDYLGYHSPFHHPTVVLRRSVALAVGGYRDLALLEDYWLWERMMLGGARMANLPEVVVDYRVDEKLFARRGGWTLYRSDLRLQRIMLADRVVGPATFLRNAVLRGAYRLAPGWVRAIGYRRIVEARPPRADAHPGGAS